MSALDLGRVVAVHPEDNSVDLVMVSNGSRVPGVQVLSGEASSISGFTDLPEPAGAGDKWDNTAEREYDTFAAVGFFAGRPVVIGFLFPQVAEVLFKRKNFRVDRHASDWYQTIDAAGNVEWAHPSGSFLRVAEDPEHEDLTGKDYDGKWAIKRNRQRQPWISVLLRNVAGGEVMRLRADPQGNVHLKHSKDLLVETGQHGTVHIAGNASVTVGGNASVQVSGNTSVSTGGTTDVTSGGPAHVQAPHVTVDGDTSIHGNVDVTGNVAITGSLSYTGSGSNGGVSVDATHTHGNVQNGPGRTSTPG